MNQDDNMGKQGPYVAQTLRHVQIRVSTNMRHKGMYTLVTYPRLPNHLPKKRRAVDSDTKKA